MSADGGSGWLTEKLFDAILGLIAVIYGLLTMKVFDLEAKKHSRAEAKTEKEAMLVQINLILQSQKEMIALNKEQTKILRDIDRDRKESTYPRSGHG